MTHQTDKWQDEWPQEEGSWWFYGYTSSYRHTWGRRMKLYLVEVRGTANEGQFAYTTAGHYLYKEEGAIGKWQKAVLPELPKSLK